MPRVSALRIEALESLAAQMRFTPRDALLRQLRRIEDLADEIDPDLNYPEDWLVFRITGYRPELPNPATIVGAALLADLSALAERASDGGALRRSDLGPDAAGIRDLCARWSVTARTLERWRRRGLIAHRVRGDGPHASVVFSRRAVEAFERRRLSAGPPPRRPMKRIDARTRERIVRMARRCRARFGWSLNETAARIAQRTGRAHETIRQVLRRRDADADEPIFADTAPLSVKERRVIHRAFARGVQPSAIARRFGRTRASVHRAVNERRAELLRRLALTPPGRPPTGDEERRALAPDPVAHPVDEPAERTLADFLSCAGSDPIPDRAAEAALARAQRVLLARAAWRIDRLPRFSPPAPELDRIETDLRWVVLLRAALVRSQRRLALQTIEGRVGAALASLPADTIRSLHRAAMDGVIAAAGAFDPSKGGRLAAPAGLAATRAMARVGSPAHAGAGRAARAHAEPVELDDWRRRLAPWQGLLDPDPRLRRALASLGPRQRTLVERRYGWSGEPPQTLAEVAASIGATVAQAATLERAALGAARRATRG